MLQANHEATEPHESSTKG